MSIKSWFLGEEPENQKNEGRYADLLGFSGEFLFILSKDKVASKAEFDTVIKDAEFTLQHDFKRMMMTYFRIDPMLKDRLCGPIGSMTVIAADDGKLSVRFHKRDAKGKWDGISKKFPEKGTTGKFVEHIFFIIDEEDE